MSEANHSLQSGQALHDRFEAGELFVPLADLTWLDVTGADRGQVLGNLTTNHVAKLAVGQGVETFITDVRGKTFGHGTIYALEDRLRICTVAGQFERLRDHIDRYVIREDVEIVDATVQHHTVYWPGISGSRLGVLLGLEAAASPGLKTQSVSLDGLSITAYQVPWTRAGDWLFVVEAEQGETLESALVAHDVLPGGDSLLHCGRIANKYPWFGRDCVETNLPQEMDRDSVAIDFEKGCYLGQETVARLDAMGQVQKKLTLWKMPGDEVPAAGSELRVGEKVVATVTSATFSFEHEAPLVLCLAKRTHFDVGSTVELPSGLAEVIG